MSDDELNLLSEEASAALLDHFEKQLLVPEEPTGGRSFSEDWNLSQFWYTEDTANTVCREIEAVSSSDDKVALISCPTIAKQFLKRSSNVRWTLFEYDERFSTLGEFRKYDYNQPDEIDEDLLRSFGVVVADPPYLSEECLVKTLKTVGILLHPSPESRIYLLTGAVMKEVALREANLRPTSFRPEHRNKLGNEFLLYTNKPPSPLLAAIPTSDTTGSSNDPARGALA